MSSALNQTASIVVRCSAIEMRWVQRFFQRFFFYRLPSCNVFFFFLTGRVYIWV